MRFRGLGSWMWGSCVASVLTVGVGCEMVPEGDEDKSFDVGTDDRDRDPNQHQDPGEYHPGGPYPGGGPGGTPVVRKLALDLSGVAGFAILDQEADTGDARLSSGGVISGVSRSLGRLSASGSAEAAGSTMWLSSDSMGRVLRARQSALDTGAVRESILSRSGSGLSPVTDLSRGWASQEDPGGGQLPPEGTEGELPALPDADGSDASDGDASAGEQAGLLKITQDGEVMPALVALEEEPVETPPDEGDSDDPSEGDSGDPSGDEPGDPSGGEPGDPSGEDPGAPTGSGGAPSTGEPTSPGDPMQPGAPPPMHYEPMPRVTAVGLSPDGNVYILFEHSFMYRMPTPEEMAAGGDLFGPGSPYRCQLFRAEGNWQDATASAGALAELECVTNQHEVRTWDARRVMQFDASGKLYFRGATPGQGQEVFYQYDPETRALSEKVNGNICWRDVQVTPRGSLFYTGISGSDGECNGTSFFRYVSSDNRLTEIARDWWNFKYLAEQDPDDPTNERIIFYGPDPNATGGYSWDSACLYRYNPAIEDPSARTQKLVECSSNPHAYIYGSNTGQVSDEDLPAFGERCTSEGQLFVGGEGVTGLSQLKDGTLFVVGNFQKKLPGVVQCGLDTQSDHCDSLDPAHTTQQACEDAGNTWLRAQPYCSDPQYDNHFDCVNAQESWSPGFGFAHYDGFGESCLTPMAGFTRGFIDCRFEGAMSQDVAGLAYVVPNDGEGLSELRLLSDPEEEVERYWALEGSDGPELFYSVYQSGQYNLRMAKEVESGEGGIEIQRRLILEDHEVYNLQRDPADPSRVLFDALQFSTNEYLFGSADTTLETPEEIQASVEAVQGVSGRVETLIVLPNL